MIQGINTQVLDVKSRLLASGLTQIDLVSILYKSGKYKSKSSLVVQMNYLLTGKRFNETSRLILEDIKVALDKIESGEIRIDTLLNS